MSIRWLQRWVLAPLFSLVWVAATPANDTFFDRNAEGWFWYEQWLEPELSDPSDLPIPAMHSDSADPKAGPAVLSAAWIREQLPLWQDRAMDDPNGPAMAIHVMLERMAIAKSEAYKDARMALTYSDPILDATSGMPTSSAGVRMARDQAKQGEADILRALAETTGVWFFYESSCPYCARQVFALEQLASRHGFSLYAISIDGHPLPNWRGDFVADAGQAEMLGVTRWPTLFLVRPPDGFAQISTGLVALPDLENRIVTVAHQQGWVSDAQWRRARAAGDRQPRLLQASVDADPSSLNDDELLALLRSALTSGYEDSNP